jgi:hypothetical protein
LPRRLRITTRFQACTRCARIEDSMISGESVESACSEVGRYTDDQMAEEFDRFFRSQPALCEFIVEVTHDSGQKIQELSLFLSYMVFKTIERSAPSSAPIVEAENIEAAYRETESWMVRISQAEGGELQEAIARSLQRDTEPHLLQYVISELNEPLEDGGDLNDEEKGEVFFVLKTVISSLCNTPIKRRIIEPD